MMRLWLLVFTLLSIGRWDVYVCVCHGGWFMIWKRLLGCLLKPRLLNLEDKVKMLVPQSCLTLCNPMDYSLPGCSVPGLFPGNNTGMGCHFLLQGIFLTQGSKVHFLLCLHCQVDSLPLRYLGINYTSKKMFKRERKKVIGHWAVCPGRCNTSQF